MPHHQELSLDSCVDTGCPAVCWEHYDRPYEAAVVNWRKFKTSVVDGWNFVDTCNCDPVPSEQVFPVCQTLATKFGGDGFSSSSMRALLVEAPIESFTLDPVSLSEGDDLDYSLEVNELVLKNLSSEVTNLVLDFCSEVEHLVISNCSASEIGQMPYTYYLTLRDISVDHKIGELYAYVLEPNSA